MCWEKSMYWYHCKKYELKAMMLMRIYKHEIDIWYHVWNICNIKPFCNILVRKNKSVLVVARKQIEKDDFERKKSYFYQASNITNDKEKEIKPNIQMLSYNTQCILCSNIHFSNSSNEYYQIICIIFCNISERKSL